MIVCLLVNDGDLCSSDGVDPITSRGLMLADGFPRDFGESQKVATGDLVILPLSLKRGGSKAGRSRVSCSSDSREKGVNVTGPVDSNESPKTLSGIGLLNAYPQVGNCKISYLNLISLL